MTTAHTAGTSNSETSDKFDETVRAKKVDEIEKLGFGVKDIADAIERYGTGTILVATGISLFVLIVLGIIGLKGSEFLGAVIITGVLIISGSMIHLYTYSKQMEFVSRKLSAIEDANRFHREQLSVGEKAVQELGAAPSPGQAAPASDKGQQRGSGSGWG